MGRSRSDGINWKYPPATNHRRPSERKFWIWKDPHMHFGDSYARKYNRETSPWRWCCTLCDPPVFGYRVQKGAFGRIICSSMPRHFFVRANHHAHVARYSGRGGRPCDSARGGDYPC